MASKRSPGPWSSDRQDRAREVLATPWPALAQPATWRTAQAGRLLSDLFAHNGVSIAQHALPNNNPPHSANCPRVFRIRTSNSGGAAFRFQIPATLPVESPSRGTPATPIRSSMVRYRLLIGCDLSLEWRPDDHAPPGLPAEDNRQVGMCMSVAVGIAATINDHRIMKERFSIHSFVTSIFSRNRANCWTYHRSMSAILSSGSFLLRWWESL